MPLVSAFSRMLQRNLLYTGLTRASESLVLLGQESAYQQAVLTTGVDRQTTLQARIMQYANQQSVPKEPQEVTATTVAEQPVPHVKKEREVSDDEVKKTIPKSIHDNYLLTNELIESHQIDPNIGLDGLTPADFMSV